MVQKKPPTQKTTPPTPPKKTNKKVKEVEQPKIDTFIKLPGVKASYFLVDDSSKNKELLSLMVRFDAGNFDGVIVGIGNFRFDDDPTNLTFDYVVHFNPNKKAITPSVELNKLVKSVTKKIINMAIQNMGKYDEEENLLNDDRTVNTKKPSK